MVFYSMTYYIYIRNWSHRPIATHLLVVTLVGNLFKKPTAPSFQIGLGWNLARVNTHQLAESDFRLDVILSKWRP